MRYVSISKGIAGVCASKLSSAKEMLIQDVGPGWIAVYKPNGTRPGSWHMEFVFSFYCPVKERLDPYYVGTFVAPTRS